MAGIDILTSAKTQFRDAKTGQNTGFVYGSTKAKIAFGSTSFNGTAVITVNAIGGQP